MMAPMSDDPDTISPAKKHRAADLLGSAAKTLDTFRYSISFQGEINPVILSQPDWGQSWVIFDR
jgi:hypothetical protein